MAIQARSSIQKTCLLVAASIAAACGDTTQPTVSADPTPSVSSNEEDPMSSVSSTNVQTMSTMTGTTILEPSSDTTIYLSMQDVSSYSISLTAEFWIDVSTAGWYVGSEWNRAIRWRNTCGSGGSDNTLYSASTHLIPNETYDIEYSEQASFTPGTFGAYQILSETQVVRCDGQFCFPVDQDADTACVQLAEASPPPSMTVVIGGPSTWPAYQAVTVQADVSWGTPPFTYTWQVDGAPYCGNQDWCSKTMGGAGTQTYFWVKVTDDDEQEAIDYHIVTAQ